MNWLHALILTLLNAAIFTLIILSCPWTWPRGLTWEQESAMMMRGHKMMLWAFALIVFAVVLL